MKEGRRHRPREGVVHEDGTASEPSPGRRTSTEHEPIPERPTGAHRIETCSDPRQDGPFPRQHPLRNRRRGLRSYPTDGEPGSHDTTREEPGFPTREDRTPRPGRIPRTNQGMIRQRPLEEVRNRLCHVSRSHTDDQSTDRRRQPTSITPQSRSNELEATSWAPAPARTARRWTERALA